LETLKIESVHENEDDAQNPLRNSKISLSGFLGEHERIIVFVKDYGGQIVGTVDRSMEI
jgi:hypothetical protein